MLAILLTMAALAGPRPILDHDGRGAATLAPLAGEALITLEAAGHTWEAPALKRWHASPDGRTLVGLGDATAPEHPAALQVVVYRDGAQVYESDAPLHPECHVAIGADGTVALAGHPVDDRSAWSVRGIAPDGTVLFEAPTPGSTLADPVVVGRSVLVLSVGDGILRITDGEVTRLLHTPDALALVDLGHGGALVQEADQFYLVDGVTGATRWTAQAAVRPVSPWAWTWAETPEGPRLGVLAGRVQRRGEPRPVVTLHVFDGRTGALRQSRQLRAAPAGSVRLTGATSHLAVHWPDGVEVHPW